MDSTPTLQQLPLKGKKVLVRVDYNVPLDSTGKITDNSRILASLPTIAYLLGQKCRVILMSHLGRPKGGPEARFSLSPCAVELARLLHTKVEMAPDCIGPVVKSLVDKLHEGEILLLENLRFHAAEENPELDPHFAEQLAGMADFYIDDAFGSAHRAHASVTEVPKLMPGRSAAGLLLEQEIKFLGGALQKPIHPFLALIGGAKISSKIGALKVLLNKVDMLAIGGGMAFTFLKALRIDVGDSIIEDDFIGVAREIIDRSREKGIKLLLPVDLIISQSIDGSAIGKLHDLRKPIPKGYRGVDIGPETVALFSHAMQDAKTILWNGPMGVFEVKEFAKGTREIALAFADAKAVTVAGGGETLAALQALSPDLLAQITHLSTGGGAALELIEFGTLPGIEALKSNSSKLFTIKS